MAHDHDEVASVAVNGHAAKIDRQHAGVADGSITLESLADGTVAAQTTDRSGNIKRMPDRRSVR